MTKKRFLGICSMGGNDIPDQSSSIDGAVAVC